MTTIARLIALALITLVAGSVLAKVPDKPLKWSTKAFRSSTEAIEHVTIRANSASGQATFIRFSVANAAYKKGALTITFKQESPSGTIYAKENFKFGTYSASTTGFGLVAGRNSLSVEQGSLVVKIAMGQVQATARLKPATAPISARDNDKNTWIIRSLFVPRGTLSVEAKGAKDLAYTGSALAFAMHEASNIKAHRVYDRSIQLHSIRGSKITIVDYIIGPKERGHRPLGFVVLSGGGVSHVGTVTGERRSAERRDKKNDYMVPWLIRVESKVGANVAQVELKTTRRVSRHDDLAKLSYFTRKAVSFLIHPFTYQLRGQVVASLLQGEAPGPSRTVNATWKYAQAR